MRALLFINGNPPKSLPETEGYDIIACSDGAFHYLKEKNFPLEKLNFISGDFDSHSEMLRQTQHDNAFEVYYTPDQDKTDFEKSLEILIEKGIEKVDVYGGSGGEMDHFLGNLTAAFRFKNQLEITFYDEFSKYFFAPKNLVLKNVKGKMISLYPFPSTENVVTKGLNWELHGENLAQTQRIGTRNFAVAGEVTISFSSGDLLIFLGQNYR